MLAVFVEDIPCPASPLMTGLGSSTARDMPPEGAAMLIGACLMAFSSDLSIVMANKIDPRPA